MGLLEDFETLEKQQTDSIEYYLYQLVLKDKHPINIDIKTYEYAKTIEPQSIKHGRVYIIVCGDKIHIGVHPVFKEIELNDFYLYLDLYTKQYPGTNVRDLVDWPLWCLIYSTYIHYDADFAYGRSNNIDGSNVSKFASERIVLIGTLDDGFRKITTDDLHQYMELYTKQWPDSDYINTLSQSIHYLFNQYVLNPYSMPRPVGIAVDDPNKGFNFEMIY